MIKSPPCHGPYPDRQSDCQQALEVEFRIFAGRAIATGWTESEVEFAMLCIAMAAIRQRACNHETDEQIRRAIRMVEGL